MPYLDTTPNRAVSIGALNKDKCSVIDDVFDIGVEEVVVGGGEACGVREDELKRVITALKDGGGESSLRASDLRIKNRRKLLFIDHYLRILFIEYYSQYCSSVNFFTVLRVNFRQSTVYGIGQQQSRRERRTIEAFANWYDGRIPG
uniref:Uncharacterized protein n=1 Tax=Tanacetum cinerariifolium TaxID=118510 RepID=A0A699H6I1_TANCI|nr:hypothetical protein [Tanacetum cinerariifolium]